MVVVAADDRPLTHREDAGVAKDVCENAFCLCGVCKETNAGRGRDRGIKGNSVLGIIQMIPTITTTIIIYAALVDQDVGVTTRRSGCHCLQNQKNLGQDMNKLQASFQISI